MDTTYDMDTTAERGIVYVKPVAVSDLPEDVRAQAGGLETLYSVHNEEGEHLALVKDLKLAYVLARQNNMVPMAVH